MGSRREVEKGLLAGGLQAGRALSVTDVEVSGHCGWRREAEQDKTGGGLVPTRREHRLPRNRGLSRRGQ